MSAARRSAVARPVAPRVPRRVSGPLRRPVALPAPPAPAGVAGRVRALPDHRVLDGLLRSRAWIWLIGILLGGIVAMQVSLLKLNTGISRAVETSATLERQNAELEAIVARLSSGERVRSAAESAGMVTPDAGAIGYLTVRSGDYDARRAARRMRPPSADAIALLKNGGKAPPMPGALPPPPAITAAPAPTTAATPVAPVTTPAAAAPPAEPAQTAPSQPETVTGGAAPTP